MDILLSWVLYNTLFLFPHTHSHSSVLAEKQLYFNWGQWTGNAHEWWSCMPGLTRCRKEKKNLAHLQEFSSCQSNCPNTKKEGNGGGVGEHSYPARHNVSVSRLLSVTLRFTFFHNLYCFRSLSPSISFHFLLWFLFAFCSLYLFSACLIPPLSSPSGCRCTRLASHTLTLTVVLNTH